MSQKSMERPIGVADAAGSRKARRLAGLVAKYRGVEPSSMPPPEGRWARGGRILFVIAAGAGAWALVFGLISLLR